MIDIDYMVIIEDWQRNSVLTEDGSKVHFQVSSTLFLLHFLENFDDDDLLNT